MSLDILMKQLHDAINASTEDTTKQLLTIVIAQNNLLLVQNYLIFKHLKIDTTQ